MMDDFVIIDHSDVEDSPAAYAYADTADPTPVGPGHQLNKPVAQSSVKTLGPLKLNLQDY